MPKKLRARPRNKLARNKRNSKPLAEGIIVPLNKHGYRSWESMSDEELVGYAKRFMESKDIKSKKGLEKGDGGLYQALRKRKLLDMLEFKEGRRKWAFLSDEELVEHTQKFVHENGIENKSGLKKEDGGLYDALLKRKLLDRLKFEEGQRDWASMSDDEIIEYAERVIKEKDIKSRGGLQKGDEGLYEALRRRKLLDKVGLGKKKTRKARNWATMDDEELVEYSRSYLEEKGINGRYGLAKEDSGLCWVLRKRKLLDQVFEDIEKAREKQAVQDVFDALREF